MKMHNTIHTFNLNIEDILDRLSIEATEHAAKKLLESDSQTTAKTTTTIRLSHSTKAYYEALAEYMGISLQAMITVVLTGLAKDQVEATIKNQTANRDDTPQ